MISIVLKKVSDSAIIKEILDSCKDSLFDDSVNDRLDGLSVKFAENAEFVAVIIDNGYAGYIAFYCNDEVSKQAYLSMITVRSDYQHKGIGSLLMDYMISTVRINNFESIKLEVNKNNDKAKMFYHRYGFKKVSEKDESLFLLLEIE
ncbi:MAG: GNAT family N-acetyltransferase [Clostridia bacterium]|nr:GNAT family N-acetyltransferase [Clostridia bacterium]